MRLQRSCGKAVTSVEMEFKGPGGISAVKEDGSWDLYDFDGAVVNLKPANLKPDQSCFVATKRPVPTSTSTRVDASDPITFCHPLFNIVGVTKCGTTMAYEMLSHHPQIHPAYPLKENCFKRQKDKSIYHYLQGLANSTATMAMDQFLVNGCLIPTNAKLFHIILRDPKSIYLLLLRSFPERMWSAYNYFSQKSLAIRGKSPGKSPKDFHEHDLPLTKVSKNFYTEKIQNFEKYFFQILVIASEMMRFNMEEVWKKISDEALEKYGIILQPDDDLDQMKNVSINSGYMLRTKKGKKGGKFSPVKFDPTKSAIYEISGYKPMLNKTIHLLRERWVECDQIRKRTGWPYNCS